MRLGTLMIGLPASAGVWGQLLGRQDNACTDCARQVDNCADCTNGEVCRIIGGTFNCAPMSLIDVITVTVTSFTYVRSTTTWTTVVEPGTSTSTTWSTVTAFTTSLPDVEKSAPSSTTSKSEEITEGPKIKGRQDTVTDPFEPTTVSTTVMETSYTGNPWTTTMTLTSGDPITAVITTAATTTIWRTTAAASEEGVNTHQATPVSIIVGAIVGVIVTVAFIAGIAWFMRKKSKQHRAVEKKECALAETDSETDSEMQLPRSSGDVTHTTSPPPAIPPFPMPPGTSVPVTPTVSTTRLVPPDPTYLHQKSHHQRNPSAAVSLSLVFSAESPVSPIQGEAPFAPTRRRSTSLSNPSAKRANVIPRKPVPTGPDAGTLGGEL